MSLGGIGGQSGFHPAQAAAQYNKNAPNGVKESGKFALARQQAEAEKFVVAERHPLGSMTSVEISDGNGKKPDTTEESSAKSVIYDHRDTNRDGKVSLQEELIYAAKQYRAASAGSRKFSYNGNSPINSINTPNPQSISINLLA